MRPLDAALALIVQGLHCFFCAEDKRPSATRCCSGALAGLARS
jgi:hypothetical protein